MSAAEPALPAGHSFELVQTSNDPWPSATLVYREGERVLAVELERSGAAENDWRTVDSSFCQWTDPAGVELEPEQTDRVLARLDAWTQQCGMRLEITPAVDPLFSMQLDGYRLERQPDGSVLATLPADRPRGLLGRLFGR